MLGMRVRLAVPVPDATPVRCSALLGQQLVDQLALFGQFVLQGIEFAVGQCRHGGRRHETGDRGRQQALARAVQIRHCFHACSSFVQTNRPWRPSPQTPRRCFVEAKTFPAAEDRYSAVIDFGRRFARP
jgi:hypothetical protein